MANMVSLFRLTHKIALSALLLLIAIIPLVITIDVVTAFIIMPAFLIFIFSLSIVVEQKLTSSALNKPTVKKTSTCINKKCLFKNCCLG